MRLSQYDNIVGVMKTIGSDNFCIFFIYQTSRSKVSTKTTKGQKVKIFDSKSADQAKEWRFVCEIFSRVLIETRFLLYRK